MSGSLILRSVGIGLLLRFIALLFLGVVWIYVICGHIGMWLFVIIFQGIAFGG